ncbi:uncharacterized protein LOC141640650 [Silene latifolia]|uniref:uncharacterized protein LOC141640650 n=1 Tax=Silene latifolia TaxID=37657 RepID=UPI003D77DCBB
MEEVPILGETLLLVSLSIHRNRSRNTTQTLEIQELKLSRSLLSTLAWLNFVVITHGRILFQCQFCYFCYFFTPKNARCGAEGQTQTMEKPTSVIQNAPGKEKSPQIDDGGTGLPPRDDDGGGGGGGGGGGSFSGGFFFFGFLAFLGFLKNKESEGDYGDSRR